MTDEPRHIRFHGPEENGRIADVHVSLHVRREPASKEQQRKDTLMVIGIWVTVISLTVLLYLWRY